MHILVKFSHGLGDAVQLTCVLQHLKKYRPQWTVDVASQIGKHTAYAGLCRRSFVIGRDHIDETQYGHVFDLGWYECYSVYSDSPCTKVCNCLREVFGIVPDLALLKYRIQVSEEARKATRHYLAGICNAAVAEFARIQAAGAHLNFDDAPPNSGEFGHTHQSGCNGNRFPVVAVHYQSNTSAHKKDLSHQVVAELCREIQCHDHIPLILDWDRRSPLPDQKTIFCPGVGPGDLWDNLGTGDAERLAALLSQCWLVIGVDSGPLHVAGATETPTLGVWKGHSPLQFYDLCSNVTHLVPEQWRSIPPCQHGHAAQFFEKHYAYRTYGADKLKPALIEATLEMLAFSREAQPNVEAASCRLPVQANAMFPAGRGSTGILTNSATGDGASPGRPSIRAPPVQDRCSARVPETEIRDPKSEIRNDVHSHQFLHHHTSCDTETPMTTATTLTWEQMPGLAHEIALGAVGSAWCLGMGEMPDNFGQGGGYSIHRWNGADWDHIDGAAVKIAVGRGVGLQPAARGVGFQPATDNSFSDADESIWILNGNGEIFRRSSAAGWTVLPGRAREIAVGANGAAWCISATDFAPGGGSIHVWNGHDWDHVDGAAVRIAVGPDGQSWIINSAGQIFRRSGEGWELLPGLGREIAIGVDGSVFCLCATHDPAADSSIHLWNGFDWEHVPGAATKIAAGLPGAILIVNAQHQIFSAA